MTDRILVDTGPSGRGWSRLASFMECPRRFALYQANVTPEDRGPLVRGTLIHVGLAHVYSRWRAEQRGENPDAFYEPADAMEIVSRGQGPLGEELLDLCVGVVAAYVERWASDRDVYEIVSVEERYEATVRGFLFTQRLDLVLRDRPGYYWINDHKTTSRIEAKVFSRYMLSGQFLAMQHYGAQKYGDMLGGVRVNVVGLDGRFERKTCDPAPHSLARFASTVEYAEANIARLTAKGLAPDDWPGALSEMACITPYGRCGFFERCRWGVSASGGAGL